MKNTFQGLGNKFSSFLPGLGISCFPTESPNFSETTKERQLYGFLCEMWGAGKRRIGILPGVWGGHIRNQRGPFRGGCGSGPGGNQLRDDK
jgi:hypothetical protein